MGHMDQYIHTITYKPIWSTMRRKLCDTDHDSPTGQPPPKKRTDKLVDSDSNIERWPNIHKRLRNYQEFERLDWRLYCSLINRYYEDVEEDEASRIKLATALHDSPESYRLNALKVFQTQLTPELYKEITTLLNELSSCDPYGMLPNVANRSSNLGRCNVCGGEFLEFQTFIQKQCRNHFIHERCFRDKIKANGMPLFGDCSCLGNGGMLDERSLFLE